MKTVKVITGKRLRNGMKKLSNIEGVCKFIHGARWFGDKFYEVIEGTDYNGNLLGIFKWREVK